MNQGFKVDTLCGLFGYSRQAYYQQMNYNYKVVVKSEILLQLVTRKRKLMPRIGGRKLLYMIQDRLPEELMLGRDSFFSFLREHGLLVRRKRYRAKTTFSNHWLRKYPNLIKEFTPDRPHQLWVSDITYVETAQGFAYLFLITDAYSRKIIGWSVSDTLEAKHAVNALHMALSQLPAGVRNVFHHSDRGVQYCCDKYVKLLEKNHFQISMTENGDPLENAIAERVNGILKTEWIYDMKFKTKIEAKEEVNRIINIYNNHRPHCSLDLLTPEQAHSHSGNLKKHWKNYWQQQQITNKEKSIVL
jgi:putative transposase